MNHKIPIWYKNPFLDSGNDPLVELLIVKLKLRYKLVEDFPRKECQHDSTPCEGW